jgi:hypothetical protein
MSVVRLALSHTLLRVQIRLEITAVLAAAMLKETTTLLRPAQGKERRTTMLVQLFLWNGKIFLGEKIV